ncbi:hypothetical protein [Cellulomonas sp. KRMCY2]|uniref:hypothetical protein n=1 Tax=Cellulomonas sp. KRMCY2 TaxID=1304865 RepID=UPI0004B69467|nr:hypothetical protein [Cellulomonas sp. KRMCY2]
MPLTPAARRRRAVVRAVAGTAVFATAVTGAAVGVAAYLRHLDAVPLVVRCAALSDGTSWYLDPDQADTAALLSATSLQRGLPARATTIALATGLQESKLRNVDHGDRDSIGIFQQRPSQGWGSVEQIMDPVYSTNAFYDALVRVDGYQELPVTEAAQAVQHSGYPDAYAQHEASSRAWASAMYGYTAGSITCTLDEPDAAGDPQSVVARVARDFGGLTTVVDADGVVEVDATSMAGSPEDGERLGWAVAHWAVSVASPLEITRVQHTDRTWDRSEGAWVRNEGEPVPAGQVRITVAG